MPNKYCEQKRKAPKNLLINLSEEEKKQKAKKDSQNVSKFF